MEKQRLLLFGDLQAHPWQEGQNPTRWHDYVRVLRELNAALYSDKVRQDTANRAIFLGDLFESKRLLRSDVASAIYSEMAFVSALISGNHDLYKNSCSLLPVTRMQLRSGEHPVLFHGQAKIVSFFGFPMAFIPFGATPKSIEEVAESDEWAVAFTHHDIEGAEQVEGIRTHKSTLPDKLFEQRGQRRVIFNGHYHRFQTIQRTGSVPVICVGAPLCHSWSDCDDMTPRGYVDVSVKTDNGNVMDIAWEHVPLDNYPRFHSVPNPAVRQMDFVKPVIPAIDLIKSITVTHSNVDEVASMDFTMALDGYLSERYPDMSAKKRKRLVELGVKLLEE